MRAAGVDERDELRRRELEAGHDDVVGAVLGDDLLEVGERTEARGVEQGEAAGVLADGADHVEVGAAAVAAQRALERGELAERADQDRAAAHAEQPHQLERDAVVARAQQRHEHRREHERDPEDAVEAVERHAGHGHGVEGRDQRHERERADHRIGAGPRLALPVEAGAREHEHEHERDELQPRRDRRPRQAEQHVLAAIGVAQDERGVERERHAGEIEHAPARARTAAGAPDGGGRARRGRSGGRGRRARRMPRRV